jgi:protein gp37
MAENSGISWTHHTQNFWLGCSKIAPECGHCYIDRMLRKMGREPWGQLYKTSEGLWKNPAKWERKAAARGKSLRIFTCSLSDFFHQDADQWRPEAWKMIRDTPHLAWLILTKRPGRILSHLPPDWGDGYHNAWMGVSTGCLKTLHLMDLLRKVPAHVRFTSSEPLLEPIAEHINLEGFHWVITGGESGPGPEYLWPGTQWQDEQSVGRRTMELKWVADLRDKAYSERVGFFFKQITAFASGVGADALGKVYHDFPAGPYPWYTAAELAEDFGK